MPADHVHFNGSVNLADAETVMREIAARVPSGLRRIPDGETGDRGNWIFSSWGLPVAVRRCAKSFARRVWQNPGKGTVLAGRRA